MPAREAPPSILERVRIFLCAHIDSDELVLRRPFLGLASCEQVRPWPTDSVLDDICEESGQYEANEQAKDGDMGFVESGLECGCPKDED